MRLLTEIKEGVRISGSALPANKLRSTLATLGIVIGIVTVTLMGTAIDALNRAFKQSISALGSDVLYVQRRHWFIDSYQEWLRVMRRPEITWRQYQTVKKEMTF